MKRLLESEWSTVKRRAGLLLLYSVASGSVGCAATTALNSFTIRIVEDTVRLTRSPQGASFHVTAVIRNDADRLLYWSLCAPYAQREISGSWQTVWVPVCLEAGTAPSIAPGDSATVPVRASAFTSPTTFPRLDPRMSAGQYRLVFDVGFDINSSGAVTSLPVERRASSTFVVVESGGL